MGKKLKETQDAFDKGHLKLEDGGQSIPTTCKKLIKLGAKNKSKQKENVIAQYTEQEEALALPSDNEEESKETEESEA